MAIDKRSGARGLANTDNTLQLVQQAETYFKDIWAYRPGIGWYQWNNLHWAKQPTDQWRVAIVRFLDSQNYLNRGPSIYRTMEYELQARLLVEKWGDSYKLVFKNGTLDLKRNEFLESHSQNDYLTSALSFDYDPDAKCDNWQKFLKEATQDQQQLIDLLQALCKWVILPKPDDRKVEIERAFDLKGRPGTGKGTFLDILMELVGRDNVGPASPSTFKDAVGLGDLIDKKLAVDTDSSGTISNPGLFNKVVSNEPVIVKRLYQDTFTTRLGVVIVRAYNSFLDSEAGSQGFDRRIIVIPFDTPPNKENTQLIQKLREELSGIFWWAWSLDKKTMKERILHADNVPAIRLLKEDRKEFNNPVYLFLREKYPKGTKSVKAGMLHKKYTDWAQKTGAPVISLVKFSDVIRGLGCIRNGKSNYITYTIPEMDKDFLDEEIVLDAREEELLAELDEIQERFNELSRNNNH